MFLPPYVLKTLDLLKKSGFEAYLVGGCVRDELSGDTPGDYDIAVSCEPTETLRCFEAFRVIETGIKHGTVTVVVDGHGMELTTFRSDGEYRDNRHPENVVFAKSIENDLARRDFTVNAMAYSPDRGLIDLFGGTEDLKNGIIRSVGEPRKRFTEDALRILRGLRFASVLGFEVEKSTAAAMTDCKTLLSNISSERVFIELKKLLSGRKAGKILKEYREIIFTLIPEFGQVRGSEYDSVCEKLGCFEETEMRLSLFLLPLGTENAEAALCSLKSDNRQKKMTLFLLENVNREFRTPGEAKRFIGKNKCDAMEKLADFRKTVHGERDRLLENAISEAFYRGCCTCISQLAVNGKDLEAMGISGREIGVILNRLLYEVTENEAENSKEALLRLIEQ